MAGPRDRRGSRGALALVRGARAVALLDGRDFVTPDDIKRIALPALRHRIALAPDALLEGRKAERPAERRSSTASPAPRDLSAMRRCASIPGTRLPSSRSARSASRALALLARRVARARAAALAVRRLRDRVLARRRSTTY